MPVDELDCVFHNWETQSILGLAPKISMCMWYRAMLNLILLQILKFPLSEFINQPECTLTNDNTLIAVIEKSCLPFVSTSCFV